MASESRARVLIVDDDADFGVLTRRRLSKLEADVDFHEGAEGASERIQKGDYAVVLLDLLGCASHTWAPPISLVLRQGWPFRDEGLGPLLPPSSSYRMHRSGNLSVPWST